MTVLQVPETLAAQSKAIDERIAKAAVWGPCFFAHCVQGIMFIVQRPRHKN